jgi:type II restriction enzyme
LETLLVHTPNFFICYPQRTNPYTGILERVQKHIMWCPDDAHPLGIIGEKEYDGVISEFEFDTSFGEIQIGADILNEEFETIAAKKTHTQIQVALVKIGNALSFRTYIARPDQAIPVGDSTLGEIEGVIQTLDAVPMLYEAEAKRAAAYIDCIWFTHDLDFIPAVVEVEHSTGVTSGLTRMLKFSETAPGLNLTFTIVAPDELRSKVVSEANNRVFRNLDARFMPYTTVRFLYGLVQKYPLAGVVKREFIEPFMERIVD